jgi:2C-methyl-D-erythritol 2,4-cyclodiphosphate synthase
MSNSTQGPRRGNGAPSPIVDALDKNKQATADVKKAADDLAVVHAVLDTKLSKGTSDGDVGRAVAETDKVEKRLTKSAEKLDEVNETLERETRRQP